MKTQALAAFLMTSVASIVAIPAFAQTISVTSGVSADNLANTLLSGSGLTLVPGSARLTGATSQYGTFNGGGLPFGTGVVLSSGSIASLVPGQSQNGSFGGAGDAAMTSLVNNTTFDASVLEFRFVPTADTISFRYVFGSNEYPEYVGREFNDAFAFFVNGQNVALIPGTSEQVSINSVNAGRNSAFYVDNAGRLTPVNLDALVGSQGNLVAVASVVPGQENTIRLVVVDVADSAVDSAVFIGSGGIVTGRIVFLDEVQISEEAQETAVEETAPAAVRATVRTVVSTISNRLRQLRGGAGGSYSAANADGGNAAVLPLSGLSGGNGANAIGMWVDYTYGNLRGYGDSNRYKAHTNTLFVGADYAFTPQFVMGLAVGYDQAHLSSSSTNNLRMSRGASATLYAGYLITDWLQASVQGTWSRLDNDIEQTTVTGSFADGGSRSDRYVLGAALSAFKSYDALTLTGTVGYNRAREGFDSYTSSDGAQVSPEATRLGQIQLGGEAAYNLEKGQAYVSATWEWDVVRSDDGDRNGAVLGAGFRYSAMENLELGLAATAQVARRDERQFTLGANVRYSF